MFTARRKPVRPVAKGRDLARVTSSPTNPEKTSEVRVGLVMYGGVSLAIYINGVTREFFRAVHGNGVYKLLKRLIDADIVVDIVSGTSAGGINGIFLGYALANGKDFSTMARLWRDHGDIGRLLHDPDDIPKPCVSLLNSEKYYHDCLREAFAQMPAYDENSIEARQDEPSALDELDLFVTSTDFDGRVYTTYDDAGHAIDVKDHRTVFVLKHRDGRKAPFAPKEDSIDDITIEALARLSRATSCFPAAFQPVKVSAEKDGVSAAPPTSEDTLREWGKLDRKRDLYFLDGGVLDNKPFSYTTTEIFHRTATRPVDRYLFYVEPDPERFSGDRKLQTTTPPVVASALAGTVGIPGYESIADDLKRITQQNTTVQHYNALRDGIIEGFLLPGKTAEPSERVAEAHRTTRLTQLCRRAVRGIVKEEADEQKVAADAEATLDQRRDAATRLFDGFNQFPSESSIPVGDETLRDFDVYYRERRVALITNYIYGKMKQRAEVERGVHEPSAGALHELNDLSKLLEIVRFNMERLVDEKAFDWVSRTDTRALWTDVQRLSRWLLNVDPNSLQLSDCGAPAFLPAGVPPSGGALRRNVRDEIHKALSDRVTHWLAAPLPIEGDPQPFHSLLLVIDAYGDALISRLAASLQEHGKELTILWRNFGEADALLFPLQVLSGVGELAEIRTVRISPYDAQLAFSKGDPKKKVAGDDLAHFSGFFKKSWRSNDILVGRLDGACQIIETLLCEERLARVLASKESAAAIRTLLVGETVSPKIGDFIPLLKEAFPHASDKARHASANWLQALTSYDDDIRTRACGSERDDAIEHLIALTQFEILTEEMPNVAEDQISEQLEWDGVPSMERTRLAKQTSDGIRELAAKPYDDISPKAAPLAKAFQENSSYGVGAENMRNITPIILLEIVMNALLVAKTAVMESLRPSLATSIEAQLLYRVFIDFPLRIGRRLIVAIRRERKLAVVFVTAFITAAAFALVSVYLWPNPLLYEQGGIQWLRVWFMLLLPIVGLSIISHVTLSRRVRSTVRWSAAFLALAFVVWLMKDYSITIARKKATVWQFPSNSGSVVVAKR